MSNRLRYLFTLAVPLAAAGFGAFWILDLGKPKSSGLTYDTASIARGAIRKIVSTSGPVRALVTVSVGSQLSGQIQELKVDFNSEVAPNDILAVLDDKTFVARVAQAKADLAMAEAQLANSEASLQRFEAILRQADRAIGRQQTLATKGITAPAALDTAMRDADVARADIAVAKAQIANARAQIEQRKAALEQTQIDLDRTRVRSPINGTVISRTIDVGQTVAASLQAPELFKIAQDLRRIRIEAQVNEADVGAINEGNSVAFTVDAYPERKFVGQVTQVRLAATELQNIVTYTVIIEAANDDRRLFPGMTANVQVETAKRDNSLRVANDALRYKPRDQATTGQASSRAQRGERQERIVEQLKDELQLNEPQLETLRTEMQAFFAEQRANAQVRGDGQSQSRTNAGFGQAPAGAQDPAAGVRQRMLQQVERVLQPLLSEAQRPLFDRWKRGRENTRTGQVWVLDATGEPESRSVRLGIADDQFTEVVGGQIKEGERVVLRAREVRK